MSVDKMKRILIITTGGTIASEDRGNGLTPAHSGSELSDGISGCETEILDLFACDSTDISPDHWRTLYKAVRGAEDYDGIVILHGTDTLEYTASMLYYTVSDMNKPIIVTGSMLPFSAKDWDGKKNISDAVKVACDSGVKGVYVVFCGRIIRGNDAVKRNSRHIDAFASFRGKECGYIDGEKVIMQELQEAPETLKIPENDKKIAVIKLSPFTEEVYVPEGYSGTVIESFGAGGVPDRPLLLSSVKKLAERMPVIMTTNCISGADLHEYNVGERALALGVIDGKALSTASAMVKLWLE